MQQVKQRKRGRPRGNTKSTAQSDADADPDIAASAADASVAVSDNSGRANAATDVAADVEDVDDDKIHGAATSAMSIAAVNNIDIQPPPRQTRPRLNTYSSLLTRHEIDLSRELARTATTQCVVCANVYFSWAVDASFYSVHLNLLRTAQCIDHDGSMAVRKAELFTQLHSCDRTVGNIRCYRPFSNRADAELRHWLLVKQDVDYVLVRQIGSSDMYAVDLLVEFDSESESLMLPEPPSVSSTASVSSSTSSAVSSGQTVSAPAPRDMSASNTTMTIGQILNRYEAWNELQTYTLSNGETKRRTNADMKLLLNIDRNTHANDKKFYEMFSERARLDPAIRALTKAELMGK